MIKAFTRARTLKLTGLLLWLAGLSLVIALIARQGLTEVAVAMAAAGYGVFWVAALQLVPMVFDTMAWQQLLARQPAVSLPRLLWVRWMGESINNLLPVARIGGEVVRGWLAYRKLGLPGSIAGASVVVDLTATIAAQILFTFAGLAVLLMHGADYSLVKGAAIGTGLLLVMLTMFLLAQRAGIFVAFEGLARILIRSLGWSSLGWDLAALDAVIREIYRRRPDLLRCVIFHCLGWLAGSLEVWAALWLLGHPVSFFDALMLESLVQALRGAAFFMPGALGLQEGGLILLGTVIGISPEIALALSLIKRLRELIWGLPGLLVWQLDGLRRQFLQIERSTNR